MDVLNNISTKKDLCRTLNHTNWFVDTGERITTVDNKIVEVWEFRYQQDDAVLSAWATHFRNHYCDDSQIDRLCNKTGLSRAEYLLNRKFPDPKKELGPSTRAGDFGEILIADYLEYILNYWVPRLRYDRKVIPNESEKGCDVIGFKFLKDGEISPDDILITIESKTQFSGKKPKPRLRDAVISSKSDPTRKADTLNAYKQRFLDKGDEKSLAKIERFQNPDDEPFTEISGAAALFSVSIYDAQVIQLTSTQDHPNHGNLFLIVIRGLYMMDLVHRLYQRAADEA